MLQKSSVASVVLMSASCNKQLIHPHELMYGKFMPHGKKKNSNSETQHNNSKSDRMKRSTHTHMHRHTANPHLTVNYDTRFIMYGRCLSRQDVHSDKYA